MFTNRLVENVGIWVAHFTNGYQHIGLRNLNLISGISFDSPQANVPISSDNEFSGRGAQNLNTIYIPSNIDKGNQAIRYYILGEERHRFVADQMFNLNIYTPSFIKIVTKNIKNHICGGRFKNTLAIVPVDHSKCTTSISRSTNDFFEINTDHLSDISVQLTDENDAPVRFLLGSHTITKMSIKEMCSLTENFHLQISSNDSTSICTENTQSFFKFKLSKVIDFHEKRMVALSSIYLLPKMMNITTGMGMINISSMNDRKEIETQYDIKIPETYCTSIVELINVLNYNFSHALLVFKEEDKYICISGNQNQKHIYYQIRFPSKLACTLGYSNKHIHECVYEFVDIMFRSDGNVTDSEYKFSSVPNLRYSRPPFVFLYCDIVQPSTLGHTSVPILKIIPIEPSLLHNISGTFHKFDVLEYFTVENTSVQTICIKICSHDGGAISYDGGIIQITLTFKRTI